MKKQAISALVLILVAVAVIARVTSGPSLESQLTDYLTAVDQSNVEMKALAEEMESKMQGLQQEIASGTFDSEATKDIIRSFQQKMDANKNSIQALTPPPEAAQHHEATVQQYQTAIDVLEETLPLLDVAKRVTDAAQMVKEDPAKANQVLQEIQAASTEIQAMSDKIKTITEKGRELEAQAKAERERLIADFNLQLTEAADQDKNSP